MRVPSRPTALGVEILLIRPPFRGSGLARELVAATLVHLRGNADELWARVYLANARALAFWMSAGFRRVIDHQGRTLHGVDRNQPTTEHRPNIILGCDIPTLTSPSTPSSSAESSADSHPASPPGHGHGDELPPLPTIQPGRWRHYKNLDYEVMGVVRHSETLEPLVHYRPLYNQSGDWVRPFAMFTEKVTINGELRPRFAPINPEPGAPSDD